LNKNKLMKTNNYKAGDCFEFKENINEFGVVFLEEKIYPDGRLPAAIGFDTAPVANNTR